MFNLVQVQFDWQRPNHLSKLNAKLCKQTSTNQQLVSALYFFSALPLKMTDTLPNSEFKMPISSSIMLKKFYENRYTQLKRKNILFVRSKISLNQASIEFKNLSSLIWLPSNFGMQ